MIDDKQFIIGKDKYELPGWKHILMANGLIFSYQEKLKVWHNESSSILLLGHAWQAEPDRGTPISELGKLFAKGTITHTDVYEMEKTWCGRYLLIVNDWIYLDTIGCLGVFYSTEHISCSLNVLCTVEDREIVYPDIIHEHDPDFIPGMRTCYEGVRRLLPSQILNIITHEVKTRPLLPDGTIPSDSQNNRIDMLERCFVHSLKNMADYFKGQPLWLGLTGGRDSRAALAMLEKSGLDYSTYTLGYKWIDPADYIIPTKLTKKLKRGNRFLPPTENGSFQKRYNNYRIHTAGMSVDHDWNYYANDQYRPLSCNGEDIVLLRSSIWENTNDYYALFSKEEELDFEKIFPEIKTNQFLRDVFYEWYDYTIRDSINKDISILNRTYWELRTGCWVSSIEQSYDMMEHITSIQPCNCRLFLSILMGFDQPDRFAKRHEEFIVQRVCPAIGKIPYDTEYKVRVKLKTRIHRILRKYKRLLING